MTGPRTAGCLGWPLTAAVLAAAALAGCSTNASGPTDIGGPTSACATVSAAPETAASQTRTSAVRAVEAHLQAVNQGDLDA